jgi:hypothetical protein
MATTIQQIELPKKARALDTSGNNNHGQVYSGRGLEFDGIGDHLSIPLSLMDGATAISISLWFNTTESNSGMIAKYASSSIYAWWINVEGGKLTANINANKSNTSDLTTTIDVNNGNWYHATLTWSYSSGLASLYINGVLVDTDANTNETDLRNGSLNNTIGFQGYISSGVNTEQGGGYHQGLLSNVQIWDAVLTASDVAFAYANPEELALNNSGTLLTESNLKLWYPMQDGHRGQQSYILDGANSGLGDELVTSWTNSDFITFTSSGSNITQMDAESGDNCYASATITSGTTYKLQFTCSESITAQVRISGNTNLTSAQTALSNPTSGLNTVYFTADAAYSYIGFYAASTFSDVQISNFTLKPINDKNHATTVFYGDELVIGNDATHAAVGNWTGQNAATVTGGYDSGDTDHATTLRIQAGDTASERAELAQGSLGTPTVAGRTYLCTFDFKWIDNTDITANTPVNIGGSQLSGAYGIDFDASGWTAYSQPFIAADSTTPCRIYVNDSGHADNEILIDNFSLKEVGAASGWTDADQQLHIPQTALQSYNELAWAPHDNNDGFLVKNSNIASSTLINLTAGSMSWWTFIDSARAMTFWHIYKTETEDYLRCYLAENGELDLVQEISNAAQFSYKVDLDALEWGSGGYIGKWIHFVWSNDNAANAPKLYVNGVECSVSLTATATTDISGWTNFATDSDTNYMRLLNGSWGTGVGAMTEVSFWNKQLSDAEVIELYNDGKALDALTHSAYNSTYGSSSLKGYWRDNGLSDWADLSGGGNNLTATNVAEGDTMLIPAGVDSTRDNQGFIMNKQKDTSCLNFPTRSGDYAEVLDHGDLDFGTGDFSYECWAQYGFINNSDIGGAASGLNVILSNGHASSSNTRGFNLLTNSSKFLARIGDGAKEDSLNIQNRDDDGDAVAYVVGDWYHIAVTRTGTTLRSYVDGAPSDYMTNMESDISVSTDTPFRISDDTVDSRDYKWPVDGVRLYSKELSAAEVLRNYNATKGSHRN